jgi:hypothetical protein
MINSAPAFASFLRGVEHDLGDAAPVVVLDEFDVS